MRHSARPPWLFHSFFSPSNATFDHDHILQADEDGDHLQQESGLERGLGSTGGRRRGRPRGGGRGGGGGRRGARNSTTAADDGMQAHGLGPLLLMSADSADRQCSMKGMQSQDSTAMAQALVAASRFGPTKMQY